jgi:hypothetical protein
LTFNIKNWHLRKNWKMQWPWIMTFLSQSTKFHKILGSWAYLIL